MGRIIVFLAGLAASTALATAATVPAKTSTAKTVTVRELVAGPLVLAKLGPFSGYRMLVAAGTVAGKATVEVEFERVRGGSTQATAYTFKLPAGALRIARNLRTATLDTGGGLGRFGRIRMTFARRGRAGALVGVLRFSTPLRRVRVRSLPARIVVKRVPIPGSGLGPPSTSGRPNCSQYLHATVIWVIHKASTTAANFGLATLLAARQGSGPLAFLAALVRHRPPATEAVATEGSLRRSALRLHGIRSAQLDASGSPFVRGSLKFVSTAPLPGCTSRAALGAASGSLKVRSDFFGTLPLVSATAVTGAVLIGPA